MNKIILLMSLVCLCTAEIHPKDPFHPMQDAEMLHKAMVGFGTDEDAITFILTHRILEQRLHIANSYKTKYNKDLDKDLAGELSGAYSRLIQALLKPLPVSLKLKTEDYVKGLYDAMKGFGTDADKLIDIIVSRSESDLNQIAKIFEDTYHRSLTSYITEETSGDFQRALLSIIEG